MALQIDQIGLICMYHAQCVVEEMWLLLKEVIVIVSVGQHLDMRLINDRQGIDRVLEKKL